MACTIDHLRVDHHVLVLRDFTDLAGRKIRAGETGILRGLGLDFGPMEIWIDLERHGARDKLRFPLRATEGPRNGHMKEYFAMGHAIEQPPAPARPTANPELEKPTRSKSPFQSYVGKQAPNDTNLGEGRVACDCDPAFHRELLPVRGHDDFLVNCVRIVLRELAAAAPSPKPE